MQLSTGSYALEPNLALLRNYQIQPSSAKPAYVVKVLLKALMQLPQPDFKICEHALSDRLQTDDVVKAVITMGQHLETANFAEFWSSSSSLSDIVSAAAGFHDAARSYIIYTISITCQTVAKTTLRECLKLEGASLDAQIRERVKSAGWTLKKTAAGELVVLPKTESNQHTQKRTEDSIKFDQLASIFKPVAA